MAIDLSTYFRILPSRFQQMILKITVQVALFFLPVFYIFIFVIFLYLLFFRIEFSTVLTKFLFPSYLTLK